MHALRYTAAFVGEVLRATFFFPRREGTFPPILVLWATACPIPVVEHSLQWANGRPIFLSSNAKPAVVLGRTRPHWCKLLNISHCALHNLLKWGYSQRITRRRRCQVEKWLYRLLAVSRITAEEVLATLLHPRKLTLLGIQRVTVKVLTTGP